MAAAITRVHMPQTDIGLLDLVRALIPARVDPEQTLMAIEMLTCYKGETVDKAVVKDAIADALGTYVYRIAWPHGWRRADWLSLRSSPLHDGRLHHARRSPRVGHALHTFHLDTALTVRRGPRT